MGPYRLDGQSGYERRGKRQYQRRVVGSSLIGTSEESFAVGTFSTPRAPVDHVSLFSADGEAEIGLTGQHEALCRFIRRLEDAAASSGTPDSKGILRIRGD